jgi:hypothetical protein
MTVGTLRSLLRKLPRDMPVLAREDGRYPPAEARLARIDPLTSTWDDDAPDAVTVEAGA